MGPFCQFHVFNTDVRNHGIIFPQSGGTGHRLDPSNGVSEIMDGGICSACDTDVEHNCIPLDVLHGTEDFFTCLTFTAVRCFEVFHVVIFHLGNYIYK